MGNFLKKNQVVSIILIFAIALVVAIVGIVYAIENSQKVVGGSTSSNWNVGGNLSVTGTTSLTGAVTQTGAASFGSTLAVTGDTTLTGALTYKEETDATIVGATTIGIADSGTTFYLASTTGQTITLPAVANSTGVVYRFVVSTTFATSNWVIDSADGDNIEGTLIVAGAVVDCDAEDQIDFVNDGENLGDYVELRSNGTNWLIGSSGALTSSKLTCTDPS